MHMHAMPFAAEVKTGHVGEVNWGVLLSVLSRIRQHDWTVSLQVVFICPHKDFTVVRLDIGAFHL